jgi:hypothetical protein
MKEKHPALRKLLILAIVIVCVFAAINLVWYIGVKTSYDHIAARLEKVTDEETRGTRYQKEVDGYTCGLSMTGYLFNSGFFSIDKSDGYTAEIDDDGNVISDNGVSVSLFIWPQTFGGYEYGVMIYSEKENLHEQIYIDSKGNYLSQDEGNVEVNEYLSSLINKYHDEIAPMLDLADEFLAT